MILISGEIMISRRIQIIVHLYAESGCYSSLVLNLFFPINNISALIDISIEFFQEGLIEVLHPFLDLKGFFRRNLFKWVLNHNFFRSRLLFVLADCFNFTKIPPAAFLYLLHLHLFSQFVINYFGRINLVLL